MWCEGSCDPYTSLYYTIVGYCIKRPCDLWPYGLVALDLGDHENVSRV